MERVVFRESVWQPVQGYSIKEEYDPVNKKLTGIIIEGNALDTSTPTRNGVLYDHESVANSCKMLEGRPMLLNHKEESLPIGHVERAWMEGTILKYRGNLDPEEKDLIRKIKRGDINNVSIQTMVDEVMHEESADGKQYTRAYPNDWAELSIVTIPGYAESTIKMAEALKGSNEIGKEKYSSISVKKKDEEFFEGIIKKNKLKIHSKIREGTNINYTLDDGVEDTEVLKEEVITQSDFNGMTKLVNGEYTIFVGGKQYKSKTTQDLANMLRTLGVLKEDISTSNADALMTTGLASKVREQPEPYELKKESFKPMSDALEVVKVIEQLGGY